MPNTSAIIEHMASSPYPPSFQGSGWAFAAALFSLLCISMIGAGTVSLAIRNMVRHPFKTLDWWMHLAFVLAGIGASVRCAADAAYKMAWGETSVQTLELLLSIKNAIDGSIAVPVIAWMTIYTLKISTLDKNKHRVLRFCTSAGILAAISAIVAFHKV